MRVIRSILLLAAIFALPALFPKLASSIALQEIIERVQNVYKGTKDFRAEFIQESTVKSINKTEVSKGRIYFKNPGKLRWDYDIPAKQEIVTDGKTLWMYVAQDRQVMINKLSDVYQSNTSTFFLFGMGDLKRDFDIHLIGSDSNTVEEGYILKLIPREPQPNINELFLVIHNDTFQVKETYFYDFYENFIRIKFKNSMINRGLSDSLFVFTIPEGVEVLEAPLMFEEQ
ncbi:MAG: outer membrane lipoprotein chaperone LolA [Thermodesulfobacteriota bacterium]|nr:outer membrane lipoprotein chaperone LolA [Thermodesulfobacteriota bacterium]